MNKKTFIFYSDRIDYTNEMTNEEKGLFLDTILKYQNWIEVNVEWALKFVRGRVKKQIDDDNNKRASVKQKRSEAWKNHTGNQYTQWDNRRQAQKNNVEQMEHNGTNGTVNDNVNVNVNVSSNWEIKDKSFTADAENLQPLDILSPVGEQTPTPLTPRPQKQKRTDIDELIGEIKAVCNEYGIAYDKTNDRNIAKHILDAKEYWEFCERIGQTRTQFAVNVLIASVKINYFKGACSWPMKIYQNYADVYNQTAMKHNKQNSLVWFLPWLNITQWQN